jgi:hypothetical protein
MGGLSRKYHKILEISQKRAVPYLLLDSGNVLFKASSVMEVESQSKISARGIAKIYEAMQYKAVNVGPHDIAAGIPFLQELDTVRWLSANYFEPSGKPVFEQYLIENMENFRVAVTGVTPPPESLSAGYLYRSWMDVLPQLIVGLAKDSDFIVLLSALSRGENIKIAQKFPEIRIILSADASHGNASPMHVNNTIITQVANQGKYLGHLALSNATGASWLHNNKDNGVIIKQQIEAITYRIARLEKISNQPRANTTSIETLRSKMKELQDQLAGHEERLGQTNLPDQSSYVVDFVALTPNIPEEKNISNMEDAIQNEINVFNNDKRKRRQQERLTQQFSENLVGSLQCGKCHEAQYAFWRTTSHSQAYSTLEKNNQSKNIECIQCHVTQESKKFNMMPEDKTFLLNISGDLKTVGCESCHGAGKFHVGNPEGVPMDRTADKFVCTNCHTPDRDDDFDYAVKRALVACPVQ